jgi:hypothetical protein
MPLADPLEVNEGTTKTPFQPTVMQPGLQPANGPTVGFGPQHGFGGHGLFAGVPPGMPVVLPSGSLINENLHHISCQQEYWHWSPEELRLADYRIGRRSLQSRRTPPTRRSPTLSYGRNAMLEQSLQRRHDSLYAR